MSLTLTMHEIARSSRTKGPIIQYARSKPETGFS
jgi:hypothetical protein